MSIPTEKRRQLRTISGEIALFIRNAILTGQLAVGSKIDQQSIADEFGVSLIPVREALRQLEAEELLQIEPYRGAYVKELSIDDLREIYVVRETLEQLAAELAVPRLDQSTLQELQQQLVLMEEATEILDFERLFELNRSFHFAIYTQSGNTTLIQLIESLWDRSTVYRRIYTYLPARARQALLEHRAILAACMAGDQQIAGKAVRENVSQTTRTILNLKQKEKGDDGNTSRK
ncbi:MAG: GntR family transcriptional regulator [Chloroflexi bacterium]|nr:GntR family transcriptional regulator [Chloroflexota bacterium]